MTSDPDHPAWTMPGGRVPTHHDGMAKEYDTVDLVSAAAGTVGALSVAARYATGGIRAANRRLRRTGIQMRHHSHGEARRAARRAVGAVAVLRGTTPPVRHRGLELFGVGAAGAVLGALAVIEMWRLGTTRQAMSALVSSTARAAVPGRRNSRAGI